MTDWQRYVLVLGVGAGAGLIWAISRNVERLLEEARRIRQALEKWPTANTSRVGL